jgi:hypothetical protein
MPSNCSSLNEFFIGVDNIRRCLVSCIALYTALGADIVFLKGAIKLHTSFVIQVQVSMTCIGAMQFKRENVMQNIIDSML